MLSALPGDTAAVRVAVRVSVSPSSSAVPLALKVTAGRGSALTSTATLSIVKLAGYPVAAVVTRCVTDTFPALAPPVTVTVCASSQLLAVNVSADGATVALAASPEAGVITTLPPGWLCRRTA